MPALACKNFFQPFFGLGCPASRFRQDCRICRIDGMDLGSPAPNGAGGRGMEPSRKGLLGCQTPLRPVAPTVSTGARWPPELRPIHMGKGAVACMVRPPPRGGSRAKRGWGSTPCGTGQRQLKPHVFGTGPSCRTARSGHGRLRVVAGPPRWKREAKTWRNAKSALLLRITGWAAPVPGPVPLNFHRFEYRWSFI